MSEDLRSIAWPVSRLGEALVELARTSGVRLDTTDEIGRPPEDASPETVIAWTRAAAAALGAEAELLSCAHGELESMLSTIGPALLPLDADEDDAEISYLAILPRGGSRPRFVCPDGSVQRRRAGTVVDALSQRLYRGLEKHGVMELLAQAGVEEKRRSRVLRGIASDRYGEARMGPFIILRPHPSSSLWMQAKHAGVIGTAATLLSTHALSSIVMLVSWYLIGRGALSGQLELGWLIAWALALASSIPLSAVAGWAQGRFAITAGRLMKQRLLYGALRLDPDAMRAEGAGSLLGRVLESTAVESLFVGGSLGAALSLIDLVFAGWVLSQGAGGWVTTLALIVYAGFAALLVRSVYTRSRAWTAHRLKMTHDLVERMVGHRTRLAQQNPARWHDDEDALLETYLDRSESLDTRSLALGLLSRAWLVVGALALGPAFIAGASPASIAIAVGGLVLGSQALTALSGGLGQLAQASIAWEQVKPLFEAVNNDEPRGELELQLAGDAVDTSRPVLEARDLGYRYPGRERSVLRGCDLALASRDRVLVEGASGSGKSTMAAVLGGLREPSAGLLLVDGLDIRSLGADAWRRRVTTVPQFHENHVFAGTFSFNALMGRAWPPAPEDLAELAEVCEELGLGPVLERMPAGLHQMVGDQGWQLSHGERSRLFLARALVQADARVWIFDESFAALDPITLERCVRAVAKRAPALVVIAHP